MTTTNKIVSWAGLILGLVALVGLAFVQPSAGISGDQDLTQSQAVGSATGQDSASVGHVERYAWSFPSIEFSPSNIDMDWDQTVLQPGQNDVAWKNTKGTAVMVDYGQFATVGTASSTFRVYVFATTSATISASQFATALAASSTNLIGGIKLATSTLATTTNSITAAVQAQGFGAVMVPDGWYLHTYMQAVDDPACPGTKKCEAATSTNRGISTITTRFRYNF